jgi:hypothetical protein
MWLSVVGFDPKRIFSNPSASQLIQAVVSRGLVVKANLGERMMCERRPVTCWICASHGIGTIERTVAN